MSGGNRFTDRLKAGWSAGRFVCVGLDPDPAQVLATTRPGDLAGRVTQFGRAIADASSDLVVAYNFAAAARRAAVTLHEQVTAWLSE